jgi:hypothetical protein
MRSTSRTPTERLINHNVGRVVAVLEGGQSIVIQAQRGGRFTCQNKGFELGAVLCYTFDSVTKKITNLVPKNIADLQAMIARDQHLQHALEEDNHARDGDGKGGPEYEVALPADCLGIGAGTSDSELLEWGQEVEADFDPDWSAHRCDMADQGEWPDGLSFHLPPGQEDI